MHLYCSLAWAGGGVGGRRRPPAPPGRPRLDAPCSGRRGGQRGGQFGWGGSLLKSNGGAQKAPQGPAGAMQAAPDGAADTPPRDGQRPSAIVTRRHGSPRASRNG
jgi:hypothetical protein